MSRSSALIVPLTPSRMHEFVALWVQSRVEQGAAQEVASRYAADGRVEAALHRPGVHTLIALRDDALVGFIVLHESVFGLGDVPDVAIEQLYVAGSLRRHGVGRQLLGAAVVQAERLGCERIVSNVPAAQRDANRFFARLGFGSSVTRRVTTTAALRRRVLGGGEVSALDQMLRRRRLRPAGRTRSA